MRRRVKLDLMPSVAPTSALALLGRKIASAFRYFIENRFGEFQCSRLLCVIPHEELYVRELRYAIRRHEFTKLFANCTSG